MAFDIASVLKTAAPENGREQIVYLDLDLLDADDANFYSLDGLEDLAANIELIGLQQPLRVRPGAGGRYVIVSGHRRRAACLLIRDGGSVQFDGGVPCIIEYGEASAAMRELRLIYANAATRVMTPAEISLQAERVQTLLYELKEEGVEFPGRMRDHVAQACQVSKTKLARLHAIRNNLAPDLLEYFDKGQIRETAAYELQKLPETAQAEIAASVKRSGDAYWISGEAAEYCAKYAEDFCKELTCPDGRACDYHDKRFVQALRTERNWDRCTGDCCLKCGHVLECSHGCAKAKAKQKAAQAERKEERQEEEERRKRFAEEKQRIRRETWQAQARRILPLIEAAGLKDGDELPSSWYGGVKVKAIRSYADGDLGNGYYYNESFLPRNLDDLTTMADKLDCSLDFLAGRTDQPQPVSGTNTGSGWQTGAPTETGMYETRVGIPKEETAQAAIWQRLEWIDGAWVYPAVHTPLKDGMRVYRWHKLPEV